MCFWRLKVKQFSCLNQTIFDNFVVCYPASFDYAEITKPQTHELFFFFSLFFFAYFQLEINGIIRTTRRTERRNHSTVKTNLWEKYHMRVKLTKQMLRFRRQNRPCGPYARPTAYHRSIATECFEGDMSPTVFTLRTTDQLKLGKMVTRQQYRAQWTISLDIVKENRESTECKSDVARTG